MAQAPKPSMGTCPHCNVRMMETAGKNKYGVWQHLPRHRVGVAGAVHYSIRLAADEKCPGSEQRSIERVAASAATATPFRGAIR